MLTPYMLFIISFSFLFVDARGEIRLDEFQNQPGIYYEFKGNIRIIQSYWEIDILIDTKNPTDEIHVGPESRSRDL